MRNRIMSACTVFSIICLLGFTAAVSAQDVSDPSIVPADPDELIIAHPPIFAPAAQPEEPVVVPDTGIFKRTPVVDGAIDPGEWDAFYTFTHNNWDLSTFADWDSDALFIAARSNRPFDLLVMLDADANGWLHGEDNYEIRAIRTEDDAVSVTICRYDSRGAVTPAAVPVAPHEADAVRLASGRTESDDSYVMELSIPGRLIRSLRLAEGRKIGLGIAARTESDESAWTPAGGASAIKQCTLVTKKIAALKPLDIGFDLRHYIIARGDELSGRFHLTNTGANTVDATHFVIAGEGAAEGYLSSQKVRIEGVPPKKHITHDIRSIIPADMPLGSWAIGAEAVSDEGRLGGALVSFDVVEAYDVSLRLPEKPVPADVKDVTFGLAIANNRRGSLRGTVRITLPIGWELWREADTREFAARGSSITSVAFKAKPPLGAIGRIPVSFQITSEGQSRTVEGSFEVFSP